MIEQKCINLRIDAISVQEINFLRLLKTQLSDANLKVGEANDYNKLLEKRQVRNLIGIKTDLTKLVLRYRKTLNDEMISLIQLIESELNTENQ